jgi:hypothetical protein
MEKIRVTISWNVLKLNDLNVKPIQMPGEK